jgi:hypothetical protein
MKLIKLILETKIDYDDERQRSFLEFWPFLIQELTKKVETSYIWFFGEKTWTSVLIYIN